MDLNKATKQYQEQQVPQDNDRLTCMEWIGAIGVVIIILAVLWFIAPPIHI